jgi:hypothetical protein
MAARKSTAKRSPRKATKPAAPVDVEAPPVEAAVEAVRIPVDAPLPCPTIRGTEIPGSDVAAEAVEQETPDRFAVVAPGFKRCIGAVIDVWLMLHQRPILYAQHGPAFILRQQPGSSEQLLGADGIFAKMLRKGGSPFGLLALVKPLRGSPYLVIRPAYRDGGGDLVLGEQHAALQLDDGSWRVDYIGTARRDAVKWYQAADAAEG